MKKNKTSKTFSSREKQLKALLKATKSILECETFEESARAIFDQCTELIGATSGYVALLSDDGAENEVLFLEAGGLPCTVDPELPMPIRGLREEAYEKSKVVCDNDFSNSKWMEFMPEGHVELRNVMFAPLNIDGKTVGIMGIANKPGDFTEEDSQVATAFGEYAALALKHSLQAQEILQRKKSNKQLHDAIDKLKEAEDALEKEKHFFEDILNAIPDTVYLFDLETGEPVRWNKAMSRISGYSNEEIASKEAVIDWYSKEDQKVLRNTMQKIIESRTSVDKVELITKDKKRVPTEYSSTTIQNPETGRESILAVGRDLSERINMEEELRKTQMHYTDFINASFDSVAYWKMPDGLRTDLPVETQINEMYKTVCVDANKACWKDICGFTHKDEMIGKTFESLTQKRTYDDVFRKFIKDGYRLNSHEIYLVPEGGRDYYGLETWFGVVENGVLSYLWATSKDITKQKKTEKALMKSEQELSLVFDSVPISIMILDQERRIVKANRTMTMMCGEDRDIIGLRGGEALRCIHHLDSSEGCGFGTACESCGIRNMVLDTLQNETDHVQEQHKVIVENIETEKKIHVVASSILLDTGGGKFAMVLVEDITERRLLEEDRDSYHHQLLQSQKMESIGHLAGGVAHDFNNMLGIIMGATQLAISDLQPNSEPYSEQMIIMDTAKRAKELTSKLLSFARRDVPNVSPVSLLPLIQDLQGMLERSLPKIIKVNVEIEEEVPAILVDQNQIRQALINICNNAADSMPNGGTLNIKTINISTDKKCKELIQEDKSNSCCLIEISDTGIGVPESIIDKIFDPFFTTKSVGKGTGLGLSVTHGIIKSHGGSISIESQVDKGTTFSICLPFANDSAIDNIAETAEQKLRGTESILIVDDESLMLKTTSKLLSRQGYNTIPTNSGKEAIELFRKHHKTIDIVVLDFIMPEMDAWDIFTELKKIQPDVKVLIASGYSEEGGIGELLKAGVKGLVQKPFEIELLCKAIRDVMDS